MQMEWHDWQHVRGWKIVFPWMSNDANIGTPLNQSLRALGCDDTVIRTHNEHNGCLNLVAEQRVEFGISRSEARYRDDKAEGLVLNGFRRFRRALWMLQ